MRILQLTEADSDFQIRRSAEQLKLLGPGFEPEFAHIGPRGQFRDVAATVRQLRREWRDDESIVHAWGVASLTAAAFAGCPRVIFSPPAEMTKANLRWIGAIAQYRAFHCVAASLSARRQLLEAGLPPAKCHSIYPAVDFSKIRPRDQAIREQLGFSPDDFVLLACGESTRAAGHRDAVWATGILNFLDTKYRLLVAGVGGDVPRLRRLANRLEQPKLLTTAVDQLNRSVEWEELTSVADALLVCSTAPTALLPIQIAMASRLPIVSTVTAWSSELLEDRHTAMMVAPGSARRLAQRVLDLRADSSLANQLKQNARAETYEHYSLSRYLSVWRAAYRNYAQDGKLRLPGEFMSPDEQLEAAMKF